MKSFGSTFIFVVTIAYSPLVSATVELPTFECKFQPGFHGGTSMHNCSFSNLSRPTQFRLSNQTPDTTDAYVKELKANKSLFVLYTKDEIDNVHLQTEQSITDLTTLVNKLRADLDNTKASLSTKLGEEADNAIKKHLASTLDLLIRQDPQFRQLLKELLKDK
ncbi:MAG: hypothetical protein BVN28_06635 [Nitrospira sp. ST-bin4]|nr:MAG: hypothetical protein BVN28_06635 [Nitrospira sp. ST-bin4]